MKGRKPTPTQLKIIRGNPGKRAIKNDEPRFNPSLPEPPKHLDNDAKKEWERICLELYGQGLLTDVDRAVLAGYCQAYARWVQAERAIQRMSERDMLTGGLMIKTTNGNAIQNPLVGTANKALELMMKAATEFGMTPSSRSRITANPNEQEENPFKKNGQRRA